MKGYIDTFKRLYKSNRISISFLDKKLQEKKITKEQYNYIIGG